MDHFVYFITGPCAAGKSTVGKMLAQSKSFERAMFIEVDSIRRMVWSGYVPPFPETEASKEQLFLAAQATSSIAKLYLTKGFTVFIEEVLEPWLLSEYQQLLKGCVIKIVCLLPCKFELMQRDQLRSEAEQMGSRCLELWQSFQEWSDANNWMTIDSSGLSPEQTMERVQRLLLG